jgi:hypothetical protein
VIYRITGDTTVNTYVHSSITAYRILFKLKYMMLLVTLTLPHAKKVSGVWLGHKLFTNQPVQDQLIQWCTNRLLLGRDSQSAVVEARETIRVCLGRWKGGKHVWEGRLKK